MLKLDKQEEEIKEFEDYVLKGMQAIKEKHGEVPPFFSHLGSGRIYDACKWYAWNPDYVMFDEMKRLKALQYSIEAAVILYSHLFTKEEVEASKAKLEAANFDVSQLLRH